MIGSSAAAQMPVFNRLRLRGPPLLGDLDPVLGQAEIISFYIKYTG